MSVRTRMIRKWRKNILRNATDVKVEVLNHDDDGIVWPKEEWGYAVDFKVNGYHCSCPDDSWYLTWQSANDLLNWCMTQPPFEKKVVPIIDQINEDLQSK